VRTLAEGEARYNPIGYHNGTVWPFDNSFITWGLRRYGFHVEVARIASGNLEAADFYHGRLPEAFGGYERTLTKYPVEFPTACSPQAWSTGAPLLYLRTMLGLEPHRDHLVVEPALPVGIGRIELLDIPGRGGRVDASAAGWSRSAPAPATGHPRGPRLRSGAPTASRRRRTSLRRTAATATQSATTRTSWSDEPLVVRLDAGRGVHPLVGVRLDGAFARLGTGAGGGVPGGPLRIGHVRRRRRLTDALGGRPGPGLLEL
jgi:hypothetical protein